MNIGICCIEINPDYSGGVNSFTFGLLDGFFQLETSNQFTIFAADENHHLFEKYTQKKNFSVVNISLPGKLSLRLEWNSLKFRSSYISRLIRNSFYYKQTKQIDQCCDVLYTPTTTLFSYNSRIPTLLSMHDIQQVHFPQFFSRQDLRIRKITYSLSAKHSDYIQVSSDFIRRDFLNYFSFLKPEQLILINEGVDIEKFQTAPKSSAILSKYNIPDAYLYYPAQLWYHKNHITVLKALLRLKELRNLNIPFVFTGQKFSGADNIFKFIVENEMTNVFYLGKIPFSDIIALYKHARFLITASLHESSCLPILEAAACGVPIIASDIPPNIEMNQKIYMNLFSATDYKDLANTIAKAWENIQVLERQTSSNLQNVHSFSWKKIAEQYIRFFQQLNYEN